MRRAGSRGSRWAELARRAGVPGQPQGDLCGAGGTGQGRRWRPQAAWWGQELSGYPRGGAPWAWVEASLGPPAFLRGRELDPSPGHPHPHRDLPAPQLGTDTSC